ncbi:hypothetical protein [Xanthobacter sediminis]
MFHTYVKTSSGNTVDFDRASFLMDKGLLECALQFRERGAQAVWDAYCTMHGLQYDKPFTPDIDPFWDRESERQAAYAAAWSRSRQKLEPFLNDPSYDISPPSEDAPSPPAPNAAKP